MNDLRNIFPSIEALWTLPRQGTASIFKFLTSPDNEPISITFGLEDGVQASHRFRQLFGFRGERLINTIGKGFRPIHSTTIIGLIPPAPSSIDSH